MLEACELRARLLACSLLGAAGLKKYLLKDIRLKFGMRVINLSTVAALDGVLSDRD